MRGRTGGFLLFCTKKKRRMPSSASAIDPRIILAMRENVSRGCNPRAPSSLFEGSEKVSQFTDSMEEQSYFVENIVVSLESYAMRASTEKVPMSLLGTNDDSRKAFPSERDCSRVELWRMFPLASMTESVTVGAVSVLALSSRQAKMRVFSPDLMGYVSEERE